MAEGPRQPSEAVRELLGLRLIATLGTINDDGSILLTPVSYRFDEDTGRLYVSTASSSRKVRNLEARPQATLLVDQRRPERTRWASASGPVEIVRGDAARAINRQIRARYVSPAGEAAFGSVMDEFDDATLVLTPERWRSWHPTDLERLAADQGLSREAMREWFTAWD